MLALTIASHLTIQPLLLAPPIVMLLAQSQKSASWLGSALVLSCLIAGLTFVSFYIVGSWSFVRAYAAMCVDAHERADAPGCSSMISRPTLACLGTFPSRCALNPARRAYRADV